MQLEAKTGYFRALNLALSILVPERMIPLFSSHRERNTSSLGEVELFLAVSLEVSLLREVAERGNSNAQADSSKINSGGNVSQATVAHACNPSYSGVRD
jgi:hypothetical protein